MPSTVSPLSPVINETPSRCPAKYFAEDPPALVAYSVKGLPLKAKVEIDAIAVTE